LTKNHQTIQLPQRNHDYAKDTVRATGLHTVWSPSTVSPVYFFHTVNIASI
jgi:hypothetical protein